ncbi:translation initiation factor IF-2 [Accipiter gentilis]|uniref:translation initiation factor IF-2 n=1 Tax=Astur gentilis TaxID=8957 RepID=UPI00210F7CEE|nr:translation initiation factor IF-2 [Accipiter gentilis]
MKSDEQGMDVSPLPVLRREEPQARSKGPQLLPSAGGGARPRPGRRGPARDAAPVAADPAPESGPARPSPARPRTAGRPRPPAGNGALGRVGPAATAAAPGALQVPPRPARYLRSRRPRPLSAARAAPSPAPAAAGHRPPATAHLDSGAAAARQSPKLNERTPAPVHPMGCAEPGRRRNATTLATAAGQ